MPFDPIERIGVRRVALALGQLHQQVEVGIPETPSRARMWGQHAGAGAARVSPRRAVGAVLTARPDRDVALTPRAGRSPESDHGLDSLTPFDDLRTCENAPTPADPPAATIPCRFRRGCGPDLAHRRLKRRGVSLSSPLTPGHAPRVRCRARRARAGRRWRSRCSRGGVTFGAGLGGGVAGLADALVGPFEAPAEVLGEFAGRLGPRTRTRPARAGRERDPPRGGASPRWEPASRAALLA